MQKINSETTLREAILALELKRAEQGKLLKAQFRLTYESIMPVNLIKSTLKEVAEPGTLKDDIINTSLGLGAGYLSKVLFEGASHNPLKKLLGTALLFGITSIVTKNAGIIKSLGKEFFKFVSGPHKEGDTTRATHNSDTVSGD